jgi:hypothetical protein
VHDLFALVHAAIIYEYDFLVYGQFDVLYSLKEV